MARLNAIQLARASEEHARYSVVIDARHSVHVYDASPRDEDGYCDPEDADWRVVARDDRTLERHWLYVGLPSKAAAVRAKNLVDIHLQRGAA